MALATASLCAALVAAALATAPADASKRVPANFFGAATVVEPDAHELHSMRSTGVGVHRLEFLWPAIEPNRPVTLLTGHRFHRYSWTRYDRQMRRLVESGIRVHAGFMGTPRWAGEQVTSSPWQTAAGRNNWPHFVAAVVDRYGPDGAFWRANRDLPQRPPIAYQVWNEQNSAKYFKPRANPTHYAKMLRSAADQIRARDRSAEVVVGGMFGTPGSEGSMPAWGFLRGIFREPGIRRAVDAVGAHPYAPSLRGVRWQMRRFRAAVNRHGRRNMPLQVTELGWSSQPKGNRSVMFYQGPKGQAKLTNRALRLLLDKRKAWKVERVLWFIWRDLTPREASSCDFCARMGLLGPNLEAKPAYGRFARVVHLARRGRL